MPLNGLSRENGASGCGLSQLKLPEGATATPQLHRHQIVVGGGESRAGEAHQHAAILDPASQTVMRFTGDVADIGEDQHGHVLIEEMRHRLRRRLGLGKPHVGERPERADDVVA